MCGSFLCSRIEELYADLRAIRIVTLDLRPPLCVVRSGPVAPASESVSSDISEEVLELLVTLHSWVKPGMVFTVVGIAIPTM